MNPAVKIFRKSFLTNTISRDICDALCGKLIGVGLHRKVFAHRSDPTLVVKVESTSGSFANVAEWILWEELFTHNEEPSPYAKWLAPCVWISDYGSILLMRRTQPILQCDYPDKIPKFLCDTKYNNFGRLPDGSFVCHDYALNRINYCGHTKAMVKAEWWEG